MDRQLILQKTADHVRSLLSGEGSGHDWWHIYRVWQNARRIAGGENADSFVVELAALLHDIADWKFNGGDDEAGPREARKWLESLGTEERVIRHVCDIIRDVSFKGAGVKTPMKTKEGMIVQDADRLDAIGAIGIARTFAYGGSKGREMYNPAVKPERHESFEAYKKNSGPTINHFYEKLLLLKDLMNTQTAKKLAGERHEFMEEFLEQFYKEWRG
jgi:uncharacterized protein